LPDEEPALSEAEEPALSEAEGDLSEPRESPAFFAGE